MMIPRSRSRCNGCKHFRAMWLWVLLCWGCSLVGAAPARRALVAKKGGPPPIDRRGGGKKCEAVMCRMPAAVRSGAQGFEARRSLLSKDKARNAGSSRVDVDSLLVCWSSARPLDRRAPGGPVSVVEGGLATTSCCRGVGENPWSVFCFSSFV
jgi:hypothetical protein